MPLTWSKFLDYHVTMITVNVSEAKARLTELIQRAEAGEKVIISRRNQPVIELRPIVAKAARPTPQFGLCAGDFKISDDFDAPLPEELLRDFEGE